MADVYSVVDKSKKIKRFIPKKQTAEFTMGEFKSPLYEAVEEKSKAEPVGSDDPMTEYSVVIINERKQSVPVDNDAEYSVINREKKQSVPVDKDAEYSVINRDKKQSVPVDNDAEYSVINRDKKQSVPVDNEYSGKKKQSVPVANNGPDSEYSKLASYQRNSVAALPQSGKNQDKANSDVSCKRFICILVTITLVTIVSLVCLAVLAILFLEVTKLKNKSASVQNQLMGNDSIELQLINQNITDLNSSVYMILQHCQQLSILHTLNITQLQQQVKMQNNQLSDSNTMLTNQTQQLNDFNTKLQQQITNQTQQLSDLQQQLATLHNETQQLRDSNTMLQQQLSILHNQTQQLSNSNVMLEQQINVIYPVTSCAALPPYSPSGPYLISASNGSAVSVYCDMTLSCGGVTGGWMRVLELDMTNRNHQCPSGLMERNDSPNIRTCVRNEASAGCSSVEVSTANIQYTRVCGRITAYQFGIVDDFLNTNINSAYVDGVSLTHGIPRQHIWTFAAAGRGDRICQCHTLHAQRPDTVGQDFFCDTGNPAFSSTAAIFYGDNLLWDGVGCAHTCCSNNNPPYFNKTLSGPTTDNIEMRVCRDEGASDEDIAIESVEIYVQ